MFENILTIFLLVVLEGLLSFDNALALAVLVRPLSFTDQRRALRWGIFGAFGFRILAVCSLSFLLQNLYWIRFIGGGYLLWLAISTALRHPSYKAEKAQMLHGLWRTILFVELTDIAFSIDSILAAVALGKNTWVLIVGGVLGIIMMRFAAGLFVGLIKKFPGLESSTYVLIAIIGTKLVLEGFFPKLDFEHWPSQPFVILWGMMLGTLLKGFHNEKEDGSSLQGGVLREDRSGSAGQIGSVPGIRETLH